jgi:hypothetical protein
MVTRRINQGFGAELKATTSPAHLYKYKLIPQQLCVWYMSSVKQTGLQDFSNDRLA